MQGIEACCRDGGPADRLASVWEAPYPCPEGGRGGGGEGGGAAPAASPPPLQVRITNRPLSSPSVSSISVQDKCLCQRFLTLLLMLVHSILLRQIPGLKFHLHMVLLFTVILWLHINSFTSSTYGMTCPSPFLIIILFVFEYLLSFSYGVPFVFIVHSIFIFKPPFTPFNFLYILWGGKVLRSKL